jgi:hypothetical protein
MADTYLPAMRRPAYRRHDHILAFVRNLRTGVSSGNAPTDRFVHRLRIARGIQIVDEPRRCRAAYGFRDSVAVTVVELFLKLFPSSEDLRMLSSKLNSFRENLRR